MTPDRTYTLLSSPPVKCPSRTLMGPTPLFFNPVPPVPGTDPPKRRPGIPSPATHRPFGRPPGPFAERHPGNPLKRAGTFAFAPEKQSDGKIGAPEPPACRGRGQGTPENRTKSARAGGPVCKTQLAPGRPRGPPPLFHQVI